MPPTQLKFNFGFAYTIGNTPFRIFTLHLLALLQDHYGNSWYRIGGTGASKF